MGKGEKLLQKFLQEEVSRIQKVLSVERKFELSVTSLLQLFIGSVNPTAEVEGQITRWVSKPLLPPTKTAR
jgi:hypothetical protein